MHRHNIQQYMHISQYTKGEKQNMGPRKTKKILEVHKCPSFWAQLTGCWEDSVANTHTLTTAVTIGLFHRIRKSLSRSCAPHFRFSLADFSLFAITNRTQALFKKTSLSAQFLS